MGSKEFSSYYSIFYIIIPIIIIYPFLVCKGSFNLYDTLYDQLLLNDEDNYLRKSFMENDLAPSQYPSEYIKDNFINKNKIKEECPMTIQDIDNISLSNDENSNNYINPNNSNEIKDMKMNEIQNKKKQEKINDFIKNIRNTNCGCLPVPEKVYQTVYLCKSIGLHSLFELNEKSKKNGLISTIYNKIDQIELQKNSNNLFLGQVPYDSSKGFILILFKLLKGLTIFFIVKLWINTLTFYNLYSTISGSSIKVKKTINNKGEKKTYYDGSKYIGIKSKLIFYALLISIFSFFPIFLIQLPLILYKKKLTTLGGILNPNMMLIIFLIIVFLGILGTLFYFIFSGTNSIILSTVKDGFNSKDHPLLNDLSYSFTLFHNSKKQNFIYYSLQLIILITLLYCLYSGFKSNISIMLSIIIVIYVSSFVSVFQFDNEANFDDIFRKCEINNANPYAYTNKFRNLPFWNITSAYIKYNYKNF